MLADHRATCKPLLSFSPPTYPPHPPFYSHRSGKRVSWPAAAKGIHDCYNFTWFMSFIIAGAGWYTGLVSSWNPLWFDLEQQSSHKPWFIEHDASLSKFNTICHLVSHLETPCVVFRP